MHAAPSCAVKVSEGASWPHSPRRGGGSGEALPPFSYTLRPPRGARCVERSATAQFVCARATICMGKWLVVRVGCTCGFQPGNCPLPTERERERREQTFPKHPSIPASFHNGRGWAAGQGIVSSPRGFSRDVRGSPAVRCAGLFPSSRRRGLPCTDETHSGAPLLDCRQEGSKPTELTQNKNHS